jgi:hypothetical protein
VTHQILAANTFKRVIFIGMTYKRRKREKFLIPIQILVMQGKTISPMEEMYQPDKDLSGQRRP